MFADGSVGVRSIWWLLQCSHLMPPPPPLAQALPSPLPGETVIFRPMSYFTSSHFPPLAQSPLPNETVNLVRGAVPAQRGGWGGYQPSWNPPCHLQTMVVVTLGTAACKTSRPRLGKRL